MLTGQRVIVGASAADRYLPARRFFKRAARTGSAHFALLGRSARVRALARGILGFDLAVKLKRGQDYVSDVETGQKIMGVVDLVEWAEAVGFDASEAVGYLQKPGKTRKVKGNR
jgi:hypothetical protein